MQLRRGTIHSVESRLAATAAGAQGLTGLFSDLVRLETELWDLVDGRLRRDHDLALSWFEPMEVMNRVPNCRIADIASALSITVGGTSKLVDRIEAAGWCARDPNPNDGRSSVLALTPAGRRLLTAAQATIGDELQAQLAEALSAERLEAFACTVQHLRGHVGQRRVGTR